MLVNNHQVYHNHLNIGKYIYCLVNGLKNLQEAMHAMLDFESDIVNCLKIVYIVNNLKAFRGSLWRFQCICAINRNGNKIIILLQKVTGKHVNIYFNNACYYCDKVTAFFTLCERIN